MAVAGAVLSPVKHLPVFITGSFLHFLTHLIASLFIAMVIQQRLTESSIVGWVTILHICNAIG